MYAKLEKKNVPKKTHVITVFLWPELVLKLKTSNINLGTDLNFYLIHASFPEFPNLQVYLALVRAFNSSTFHEVHEVLFLHNSMR